MNVTQSARVRALGIMSEICRPRLARFSLKFPSCGICRLKPQQLNDIFAVKVLGKKLLVEMCLAGVSARRMEDITEAPWASRASPSTISGLNQKFFKRVEDW